MFSPGAPFTIVLMNAHCGEFLIRGGSVIQEAGGVRGRVNGTHQDEGSEFHIKSRRERERKGGKRRKRRQVGMGEESKK